MGAVCVANKKNNLTIKDDVVSIKCKITFEKTSFNCFLRSNSTFKEIKAELAKKIKKDRKILQLEVKGKLITYEQLQLCFVIKDKYEEINIKIIEQSINDIERKNSNISKFNSGVSNSNPKQQQEVTSLDENSIFFLSKTCEIHNTERLTIICQLCGVSICEKCKDQYHKEHQVIKKIEIVEFNKSLQNSEIRLKDQLEKMRLKGDYLDYLKNFRLELMRFTDDFVKIIDYMKRKESEIVENFKNKIDVHLPSVLCYRDNIFRINKDYENNLNSIISDDNAFMRYYQEYLILNAQFNKNSNDLSELQINLKHFGYISDEYKKRAELLANYAKEQLTMIEEYNPEMEDFSLNYHKQNIQLDSISQISNNKNISVKINPAEAKSEQNHYYSNSISSKQGSVLLNNLANFQSQNKNSINLKTLMQTPNKNLSELIKIKKKKQKFNSLELNEDIQIAKREIISPTTQVFSKEIGTNFLYIYDIESDQISRERVILKDVGINKFESYHSSLNYNNKFYISGNGLNSKKNFFFVEKIVKDNNQNIDKEALFTNYQVKKLPDMINNHSFHGMLGWNLNIFLISGFNTNKVDMFHHDTQSWIKFPDINKCRTWASSLYVEEQGLFVFGGFLEDKNEIVIEKLDNKNINKLISGGNVEFSWELLTINCDKSLYSMPAYSGFIFNESTMSILILGGRLSTDSEENEQKVYNLNLNDLIMKQEDFLLSVPDEFDGRLFVEFKANVNDEEKVLYGQFSAGFSRRMHIYDKFENKMSIKECKDLTESSISNIN